MFKHSYALDPADGDDCNRRVRVGYAGTAGEDEKLYRRRRSTLKGTLKRGPAV